MAPHFSLNVVAELQNLAEIRDFVEKSAAMLGVTPSIIPNLQLAVDEAVTNIILHGYRGQVGQIEIVVERRAEDLVISLHDYAPPFDPTSVAAPDLTLPLAERVPGGMGLHLIRQTMDQISYRSTEAGGNQLTLVKQGVGKLPSQP
jgi:serine/threonine-protein kinase RsbW